MNAIVAGKQEKPAGSLVWKTDIVCEVNTTFWTCPSSYYETHMLKVTDTSNRTAYFRIYNFQGDLLTEMLVRFLYLFEIIKVVLRESSDLLRIGLPEPKTL